MKKYPFSTCFLYFKYVYSLLANLEMFPYCLTVVLAFHQHFTDFINCFGSSNYFFWFEKTQLGWKLPFDPSCTKQLKNEWIRNKNKNFFRHIHFRNHQFALLLFICFDFPYSLTNRKMNAYFWRAFVLMHVTCYFC